MRGIKVAVIIPFRDRGTDPLRQANLYTVLDYWHGVKPDHWWLAEVDDGRSGDQQFNRSCAYNAGVQFSPEADVYVFAESDVIVPLQQVVEAIGAAYTRTGLVVPFDTYRYRGPEASERVRQGAKPQDQDPKQVMRLGASVGAVNVISRNTYELVGGYDECFEGSWYDDNAMMRAFEQTCSPTRWIEGPVHHLYHLPGWTGNHLTEEDKAATARNKERLERYRRAFSPQKIRQLTMEGRS